MSESHLSEIVLDKLESIRSDFPILSEKVNNHDLVYLDNAATSQKPNVVIDAISDFYKHSNSNVHRGVHSLSQKATTLFEEARTKVQKFINARSSDEIVFTSGTTDSINLVAHSLSEMLLIDGGEVLVTEMEHHSNFVPWQMLSRMYQCKYDVVPLSDDGSLNLEDIESRITDETKILAITHASNSLGSVNDIKAITKMAHDKGAVVVVDGAQYIPHHKVDVQDLNCDFYAFSSHKLLGPTGMGILYGKSALLEKMPPYQYGGGMISEVKIDETSFGKSPQIFEAGTPNIAGAYATGIALDYINQIGFDFIEKHEKALLDYASEQLSSIPDLRIIGDSKDKVSLISFVIDGLHPFDIGTLLDQMGIAVRTGHHCTQPVMTHYNIPGTIRASFAFYNNFEEIDKLTAGIKKSIEILK